MATNKNQMSLPEIDSEETEVSPGTASASRETAKVLPPKRSQRIYSRVVYTRVTEREWQKIQAQARLTERSMSRYLVETSLHGKPPASGEDRERLRHLLFQFRRVECSLRQLSKDRLILGVGGELPHQLHETAVLLDKLAQEMLRRIAREGGSTSTSKTVWRRS